ncbi:MAG: hypothetical protein GY841_18220, partial [FCB group bacterium]|nr:hypothetical protein [FCB group bacterium]
WNCLGYDSSGNSAWAQNNYTVELDTTKPLITIALNDSTLELGIESLAINWSIFEIHLDYDHINVTLPNGSLLAESTDSMVDLVLSPENLSVTGTYAVTVYANDTASNWNTSSTTFNVSDTLNPAVYGIIPSQGATFNVSDEIEITANITDSIEVHTVLIDITLPNTSVLQFELSNTVGDLYSINYTIPDQAGNYTVSFIANDTTNNVNSTETTVFVALANTNPTVHDISYNTTSILRTQLVEVSCFVSDVETANDSLTVDIYYERVGDGSWQNLSGEVYDSSSSSWKVNVSSSSDDVWLGSLDFNCSVSDGESVSVRVEENAVNVSNNLVMFDLSVLNAMTL